MPGIARPKLEVDDSLRVGGRVHAVARRGVEQLFP